MNVIGSLRRQLSAPFDSKGSVNVDEKVEMKVVENQRFNATADRWSFKYLKEGDPKRFSSEVGDFDQFPTIPLPAGWEYVGLWEIDYKYPEEAYGPTEGTGGSKEAPAGVASTETGDTPEKPVADAPGEDSESAPRPSEWVYSSSFDDLRQGIVLDPSNLGSGSNTPMSPSSPDSSAVTSDAVSASLLAALEAEYSLGESRSLVRQRRYRRTIVRSAGRKAEAAAALLTAKGTAIVNTTSKVLSSTNRFITDLGDAHKKDLSKLINATKQAATKTTSTPSATSAPSGDEKAVAAAPAGGEDAASALSADAADASGAAATPAEVAVTSASTPNAAPATAAATGSNTGTPSRAMPSRVTSFSSRLFGSLTGSSNASTPPPPTVAAGASLTPQPAAHIAESGTVPSAEGSVSSGPSSQATTPTRPESLPRKDTMDSTTSKGADEAGPTLQRKNTNASSVSGTEDGDQFAVNDNFEMEVDLDSAEFNESASEMGDHFETSSQAGYFADSPNPGQATVGGVANPAAAKRRSSGYFGGFFGGSRSDDGPPPPPVVPIDPIFKVVSPALASIGRQLRNVEQQNAKAQEAEQRAWRHNVKPVLEVEIAALEKQCAALMAQIEREAGMGNAHLNSLEGVLKELNDEMDIKKRKVYLPESAITLGTAGVYVGLNDFWLQMLSGHYIVNLVPKKDAPSEISILLSGTNQDATSGVTVKFRAEGFKLAGDKGKKIPKLAFENLKLEVSLTLQMTLSFDTNTKKWLLPSKGFNLKILSFKGPYGINRSMVGAILSLVTPMIRTAIIGAIPHEVGMLLHSLPADFTLRGEFDVHGMDMSVLSTEFHKSEIFGQLSGYSAQQLEMFVLMQRAMERSTVIKTLSDLIIYRRKYASHKDLWTQLVLVWGEACHVYCEHVITAKMEQLIEQASGSINPLQMSIRFDTFLMACDDILHKRTTAKCRIQYIDGQISLNELIQFIFQVQHRLASDEVAKSSGLKKVRLQNFIESLQTQFALARALVSLVCQNFDFAHLTIVGKVHSGPQGECVIKIADLLAQAPVLLNLAIMEEKNIGALSLVPYILSFKPQENGDVCLELYSFNHDVALPVAPTAAPVSPSPTPSFYRAESTERMSKEILALQQQYQQSMENSSAGQSYSNNYNKLLNAITVNRAAGHSRNHALSALYPRAAMGLDVDGDGTGQPSLSPKRNLTSAAAAINQHLAVKHSVLHQALTATLSDYPTGEESDTICQIVATNPHISVIVDQAVKLAAGTELLTILVGPKVKTWKPLGRATLEGDGASDAGSTAGSAAPASGANIRRMSVSSVASQSAQSGPMGCPIKVQTAPGIKMLTQVEKADVNLNLPGLIRFLLAHFRDVPLLKEYLEIFVGGVFMVEHLGVVKLLIEKIAKYLLLPGLDLDINLNIRIVVNAEEIVVRVETPDGVVSGHQGGLDLSADNLARIGGGSAGAAPAKRRAPNSAVDLSAEISVKDLVDDITEVMEEMKVFLDPLVPPTVDAHAAGDSAEATRRTMA